MPDPEVADRAMIPVPTFALANGQLTRIDWHYRATGGSSLPGAPGFVRQVQIQLLDSCGRVIRDSRVLDPASTTRPLSPTVPLASVAGGPLQVRG